MSAYAEELFLPQAATADEFAVAALNAIQNLPINSRVLDIGCGTGDMIRRAYQIPGISFVGIDISRPNIETAKATAVGAEFHCADFRQFDAGQFDVVFANSILHLIDCHDNVITAALFRSLKPGGVLVASMPVESIKNKLLSGQRTIWRSLPTQMNNFAVWVASFFTSQTDALRKRLIYLRMPPTRVLGRRFIAAMENGLHLEHISASNARHPLKLDHAIAVWRKVTDGRMP